MASRRAWLQYEREVQDALSRVYSTATLVHNVRLMGKRSCVKRQLDVLITQNSPGGELRIAVDAKRHVRRINVKQIEAFIGLLRDIDFERGLMISETCFTKAALQRAFRDDVDLDLDIMSLADLQRLQAESAILYAGRNAFAIPAPLRWIIDGQRRPGVLATMYRRGLVLAEAVKYREFMYANIVDRQGPQGDTLQDLVEAQNTAIKTHQLDSAITVTTPNWRREQTCMRRSEAQGEKFVEVTGFVEFTEGILFVVLHTPHATERRNTRKLEYILRRALPISMGV